jgi:hypothetical protein
VSFHIVENNGKAEEYEVCFRHPDFRDGLSGYLSQAISSGKRILDPREDEPVTPTEDSEMGEASDLSTGYSYSEGESMETSGSEAESRADPKDQQWVSGDEPSGSEVGTSVLEDKMSILEHQAPEPEADISGPEGRPSDEIEQMSISEDQPEPEADISGPQAQPPEPVSIPEECAPVLEYEASGSEDESSSETSY